MDSEANLENVRAIQLLNTMYRNNIRQIDQLLQSNDDLRRSITELLRSNNNRYRQQRNQQYHQQQQQQRNPQQQHNLQHHRLDNNQRLRRHFNSNTIARVVEADDFTVPVPLPVVVPTISQPATATAISTGVDINSRVPRTPNNTVRNNRVYLNNVPYTISDIQRFTIPSRIIDASGNDSARVLDSFFDPVNVFPSSQQIDIATRVVRYGDIVRPTNQSCPITLDVFDEEDIVTLIRHCSHVFNSVGINHWFRTNCRCPVCRYDIRNYNNPRVPPPPTPVSQSTPDTTNATNSTASIRSVVNDIIADASGNSLGNWFHNVLNAGLNSNSQSQSPSVFDYIVDISYNVIGDENQDPSSVSFYFGTHTG